MRPAEGMQLRNIAQFAHRAVRLGGVGLHRTLKDHGLHHQLRQFADGQLLARAHIDVAIADLAQRGDVPAAARRVVAVHDAVCGHAVMHGRILLNLDDILANS